MLSNERSALFFCFVDPAFFIFALVIRSAPSLPARNSTVDWSLAQWVGGWVGGRGGGWFRSGSPPPALRDSMNNEPISIANPDEPVEVDGNDRLK